MAQVQPAHLDMTCSARTEGQIREGDRRRRASHGAIHGPGSRAGSVSQTWQRHDTPPLFALAPARCSSWQLALAARRSSLAAQHSQQPSPQVTETAETRTRTRTRTDRHGQIRGSSCSAGREQRWSAPGPEQHRSTTTTTATATATATQRGRSPPSYYAP